MLSIVGGLLVGWILQLFGFDHVVAQGVLELFGKTISITGYYFIFAMIGAINWIANMVRLGWKPKETTINLKK